MKRLLVVMMAVIALTSLLVVPAFAVDNGKLIVKNSTTGNTVFVVQDTGSTGIGTSTPEADLYVSAQGSVTRGIISAQHSDNTWAALSTYVRSRGTQDVPAPVQTGDYLGFVVTHPYDGAGYSRSGGFGFRVDGPVSAGSVPVALDIITGTGNSGPTTYGTERLTITSSGRVGIGTTMPTNPLQFGAQANGAYIDATGSYHSSSSRQYKDDIQTLSAEKAVEAIKDLSPVTYIYTNTPDQRRVGFIAEDVPELVGSKDRKTLVAMDIVAVLTKVVQEQNKTIAELSEKLNKLEAQVTRIKSKEMFGSVDPSMTSGN